MLERHCHWLQNLQLSALIGVSLPLLLGKAQRVVAQVPSDAPRFEALRHTIDSNNVRSVDALLPLLSPVLRSRYALVFDSRSVQGASYSDPRVLLFGGDAHFIVSFNGDARQRGSDSIETMEFSDANT
jgi:hypothetical protein